MIKVTRNKKKSKLPQLAKKLLALNEQKAKIGYFQDSGVHTLANMSYASLAFIHAFPINGKHIPRNIFEPIKPIKNSGQDKNFFKRILKQYVQINSKFTLEDVLDEVGREWRQRGEYVFGNTSLLETSEYTSTPLIDTSELKDAFGFRTTFNYTLRNAL